MSDDTTPASAEQGAMRPEPFDRPLPVIAWLASTPDGDYALALTEQRARNRAGGTVNDVVPLTLHAAAQAEIDRLRALLQRQQASYEREMAIEVAAERERRRALAADFGEYLYRTASQVPMEHAEWAQQRGAALLDALKA